MKPTWRMWSLACVVLITCSCRAPDHAGERADLYYLASPALQGRQSKTAGDKAAQDYIQARFKQLGLVPWRANDKGDYGLPFPFGTNLAGVLRGSDPKLAEEYVLLTAHHDHLGVRNGKIYPGACDNAAGVAALLEIAKQIASQNSRPRRSICFLATDAEEMGLFGAFAFACDKDFKAQKIIANVNMDCLGRTSFEAIEDVLLLVGSENYPALREQTRGAALAENLRILPLGSDILGPRGDHVVFAELGVPSLFFTCGMYKDYHQPSDTPDKIDYKLLARQTRTIGRVVNVLANETRPPLRVEESAGDREELVTVLEVVQILKRFGFFMGLPSELRARLPGAIKETEAEIAAPVYSAEDRQAYWEKLYATIPPGLIQSPKTTLKPVHEAALAGMGELIRHGPSTQPLAYKALRFGTRDPVIHFESKGNDRFAVDASITAGAMEIQSNNNNFISLKWGIAEYRHEGTRDEVIDACLADWANKPADSSWSACWRQILTKVTGADHGKTYAEWMKWRGPTTRATARSTGS